MTPSRACAKRQGAWRPRGYVGGNVAWKAPSGSYPTPFLSLAGFPPFRSLLVSMRYCLTILLR